MLELKFYDTENEFLTIPIENESNLEVLQILDHNEVDKSKFRFVLLTSSNLIKDSFLDFLQSIYAVAGTTQTIKKVEIISDQTFTINLKNHTEVDSDFSAYYDFSNRKIAFQCYIESIEE